MVVPRGKRGLSGLRVAVTRAPAAKDDLVAGLEALGAQVVVAPLIGIVPPADSTALEAAARRCGWYDWVVFTSANGVERFWEMLVEVGGGSASFDRVRVACIGPVTAAAALARGLRPDLIPDAAVAESLLDALLAGSVGSPELEGMRILLPVAAGARRVLEAGLAARGAEVDRVAAYRTIPDPAGIETLRPHLAAGDIDLLTFASPSAVDNFMDVIGSVGGAEVGVIGPITARAARRRGLTVQIEAAEYTGAGLLRAIVAYYD